MAAFFAQMRKESPRDLKNSSRRCVETDDVHMAVRIRFVLHCDRFDYH